MTDTLEIFIPENAGLQDYRYLLSMAENEITKLTPLLSKYKVSRANARAAYDDAHSTAKIAAIAQYGLKPNHQTMINAYAGADEIVKHLKHEWLNSKALEIKAMDRLDQVKGMRDTLKAMVKSEHVSY